MEEISISTGHKPAIDFLPENLKNRWIFIRNEIGQLAKLYKKEDLIRALIRRREDYTNSPTLSEIMKFSGIDIAIHRISNWEWKPNSGSNFDEDVKIIALLGAELTILYTIGECIRNNLIEYKNHELLETEMGSRHFCAINSFNIYATGTREDIAKHQFRINRMSKNAKNNRNLNIPVARQLFFQNTMLMLLRTPLPFYKTRSKLTVSQTKYLLQIYERVAAEASQKNNSVQIVKFPTNSEIENLFKALTPDSTNEGRVPSFYLGIECAENQGKSSAKITPSKDKIKFEIGVGSFSYFATFLLGFDRETLTEKSKSAELAVRRVFEENGHFEIVDTNTDIECDKRKLPITEIDIIAKSKVPIDGEHLWIHCEVKDYSYWKGWLFGQGIPVRRSYFLKAVSKLSVKEDFIKKKYSCSKVKSVIVTTIREVFDEINDIPIIDINALGYKLSELVNSKRTRTRTPPHSNYFIKYYNKLQSDLTSSNKINEEISELMKQLTSQAKKLKKIKSEYDQKCEHFKKLETSKKNNFVY